MKSQGKWLSASQSLFPVEWGLRKACLGSSAAQCLPVTPGGMRVARVSNNRSRLLDLGWPWVQLRGRSCLGKQMAFCTGVEVEIPQVSHAIPL